jgi:signal transduction histidine kinase
MTAMSTSPRASQRMFLALAGAGLAFGLVVAWLTLASDHVEDRGFEAALGLLVGWSFIGTGLYAWWVRPENRTGLLMAAVGFAWFATGVSASDNDLVFTIGIALDGVFGALLGHLLIAFPTGRLATRAERLLVTGIYLTVTVLQLPALLFEDTDEPRNLLMVESNQDLSDLLDALQFAVAFALIVASLVIIARRRAQVAPAQRPVLAPVLWTGGATLAALTVALTFDAVGSPKEGLERLSLALFATVPFGFLVGGLRTRLAHGAAVSKLIARLGQVPGEEALRTALAEALGDPSLRLAYWLPDAERFVDAAGRPFPMPERGWTAVELHGRRVAAIVHDPALDEEPQLVRTAGAAAALALENQRLSAELRARIEDLRASRARIVEAGDAERHRLERDLHDGAQSRLVALAMKLRMARRRAEDRPDVTAILDESSVELQASLDELRELARGIHPAVLTDRGLGPALEMLASRAPVPVDVAGDVDDLPPAVATAVYFVVSEGLTNVAKYARARHATVTVSRDDNRVVAEVADDGVGGADLARGSGLRGLVDRVAALDGSLELHSPPESGTRLRAEFPLRPARNGARTD